MLETLGKNATFAGLYESYPVKFKDAQAHNAAIQGKIISFGNQLKTFTAGKDIEGLKAFIFEKNNPEAMDRTELMEAFTAFRNLNAFKQMQDLYFQCDNGEFQEAPMVREFLAVSYNKMKPPEPDQTILIANRLLADGENPQSKYREYINRSEVYGAIAKAYLLKGDHEKSRENYEKGFYEHFDYYPGINAAYEYIAAGNIEKAKEIAELTYQSCVRDGGLETRDYWCTSTMLESACLIGMDQAHIQKCLDTLLSYDIQPFHKDATLGALKERVIPALEKLKDKGDQVNTTKMLANIRHVVESLEAYKPGATVPQTKALSPKELVFKSSYSSRGISGWETEVIAGNAKYGGAVADIAVSRFDRVEFGKLLKMPLVDLISTLGGNVTRLPERIRRENLSLSQITDSSEFIKCAQSLVRENYGNEQKGMEIIDYIGHTANHDLPTEALYSLAAVPDPNQFKDNLDVPGDQAPAYIQASRKLYATEKEKRNSADITTNAIAEFVKGLGDCRHHGQAGLQILFNLWQREQTEKLQREAVAALDRGNKAEYKVAKDKVNQLLSEELRVFDVDVFAPVEMIQKYKPKRPVGFPTHFIADTKVNPVEEHTMTFLVKRDRAGGLEHMRFADAFYQKTYGWGDGEVNPADIQVSEDGKLQISGGRLKGVDGAKEDSVPVTLKATAYAGQRTKTNARDLGCLAYELGIPIENFNLRELLNQRNDINTNLKVLTQSFLSNQTEETLKKAASQHSFSFADDVLVAVLSEHEGVALYSYGKPRDGFELTCGVPHWRSGYGGQYEMTHTNVPAGTMIAIGDLVDLKIDDIEQLKTQLQKVDIYPTGHDGDFTGQDVEELKEWFHERSVRDDSVNDQNAIAHAQKITPQGLGQDTYNELVQFLTEHMNLFKDKQGQDKLIPEDRAARENIVRNILDGISKSVRYTRKDAPAIAHQFKAQLNVDTAGGGKIEFSLEKGNKIIVLRKAKENGEEKVVVTPLDISMVGKTYVTADGEPLGDRGMVDIAAIVARAAQIEMEKARGTPPTSGLGIFEVLSPKPPKKEVQ